MLKKIRLDKTRIYEIALATNYIATMLDAFIEGRNHIKSLGCEQGDLEKWDDLVLELDCGVLEHIQVKRQLTPFSTLSVVRGVKKTGKDENIGNPQDRSPLDESLVALAQWSKDKSSTELNTRRFVIEVPDYTVEIKKDYSIRHFVDLSVQHVTNSVTELALIDLANLDTNVKKGFDWLTTWCDFDDWTHIIKALNRLEIRVSGLESDLEDKTENILERHFIDKGKARQKISSYIDENSSYTAAIKPRTLLAELETELIRERGTWSQYDRVGTTWGISGTTNLRHSMIEEPQDLTRKFWGEKDITSLRVMTQQQSHNAPCKLTSSLIRFSLHFEGNSNATFNELGVWTAQAQQLIGGTLGISDHDFKGLNWRQSNLGTIKSENRALTFSFERDAEAKKLSDEMYRVCWDQVCNLLESKNSALTNIPLRDAIEERWVSWKVLFNSDVDDRNLFLKNMLSPKCEGDDIFTDLRVGPKTVNILADGIKFLLIVSTALYDKADCWNITNDGREINTLALNYWAGPSGMGRSSREITDENGIETLLGTELDSILIMSQVASSPSDVLNESLAFDMSEKDSLATSKTPDLLITNSMKFKRLVNKGSLKEIRDFFEQNLRSRELIKEESIQGVISV
ncbi:MULTISPECIES: ABC-three component system protein [unclassified Pseudoalteromonas]|uniref:ABC-three component system protein n=1 Tax=unclassified Pseudoalteromonas TaxID=194690 RepID=UPI0013FDFE7E|nr:MULTISPECIES: ABC-three component system protein [unclassified Pseudoalteromonas]